MALYPFALLSDAPNAAFAITPHNANPLICVTKAIYVGGAGVVTSRALRSIGGVVYRNVPAGAYLTVRASHVRATGTTAINLVGEA